MLHLTQNFRSRPAVLAAVNEALTSSQEMASKRLGGITGGLGDLGLNLPGM